MQSNLKTKTFTNVSVTFKMDQSDFFFLAKVIMTNGLLTSYGELGFSPSGALLPLFFLCYSSCPFILQTL